MNILRTLLSLLALAIVPRAVAITVTEPPDFANASPGLTHTLTLGANTFSGTVTTPSDGRDVFQVTVPVGMRIAQASKTVTGGGFSGFVSFNGETISGTGTANFTGAGATPYPLPAGTYEAFPNADFSTGSSWSITVTVEAIASTVVTSTANSGAGSLRQALADAAALAGADTVTFAPGFTGPIVLSSQIVINDATGAVTIDGSTVPGGVTIDGGAGANRIFTVNSGSTVVLQNLTLTGGDVGVGNFGGAIDNPGTLTVADCTFSGNTAGNVGGAIRSSGALVANRCTFAGNSAGTNGGAVGNDAGTAAFTDCTFTGNSITGGTQGGGALNHSASATSMTLTHCTIAGNSSAGSQGGGGIRVRGPAFSIQNCIVAGNTITAGVGADIDNSVAITATGGNIVQSRAGAGAVSGTLTNADPRLAPLASNGGATLTMALLLGSPALDAGTVVGGLSTDQRGFARNLDGDDVAGALPDIGAVEVRRTLITTAADQLDTPAGAATSLREALRDVADHVFFSPAVFTGGAANVITLDAAKGEIVAGSAIITAASVGGVTIDGGTGANRIFSIGENRGVQLERLTLTGGGGAGAVASGWGGAIYQASGGTLALTDCTVAGNAAPSTEFLSGGGGIYSESALVLTRCTFNGNTAALEGGAVRQRLGDFTATHCTFGSNTSGNEGGGVSTADDGTAVFTHCTFSLNHGGGGGGLFAFEKDTTLTNCVLAGNTRPGGGAGADLGCSGGSLTRAGANLVPSSFFNGVTPTGPAFLTGSALLSALGDWGGLTRTFYPQPGSAALGQASVVAGLTTDQRGAALPASGRDLGAVQTGVVVAGAPLVVTTALDGFDGFDTNGASLREVATLAGAGSTITFAQLPAPIVLGSEIILARNVTLDGGAGGVTIDGGAGANRIFSVSAGQTVVLKNLTLTGGNGGGAVQNGNGGAIFADTGSALTLSDCTVSGNTAPTSVGGGVFTLGALTLTRCTFSGNSAAFEGGAVRSQASAVTAVNCTFSGNSTVIGGACSIADGGPAVVFTHCTVAGNTASGTTVGGPLNVGGGGLFFYDKAVTLTSCLIAGNTSPYGPDVQSEVVAVTSGGGNLIGNNTGLAWSPLATDQAGTGAAPIVARLAPLASNGGPTPTRALLPGSPALDRAIASATATDQRGFTRSRDGDAVAGALPDVGAYEAQLAPYSIGFNFVGGGPAGSTGTLAATDRAGVPAFAQENWNNLSTDYDGSSSGSAPNAASRNDAIGASVPSLKLWWDAPNTWGISGTVPDGGSANGKLMNGYLDSNNTANTGTNLYLAENQPFLAVAGLPAALTTGGYKVIAYGDGDAADGRTGEYWLASNRGQNPSNVAGETDLTSHFFLSDAANFTGTFTRVTSTSSASPTAGNYVQFDGLTEPAFTVRTSEVSLRSPINAVQIVRNEIVAVTTAADENDPAGTLGAGVSLREALRDAAPGSGIVFDSALSGATIALGSELLVTKDVVVDASNLAGGLTLDGQTTTRILRVLSGTTCTFTALTLANGKAANTGSPLFANGSGIHNSGTLTVSRCTFTNNSATQGGGIASAGALTVNQSTFANNSASDGGGIGSAGTLMVNQSTFANNSALNGGGIANAGTLIVNQSTLTSNSASFGGGIYNDDNRALTLTNSIVATNTGSGSSGDIQNDPGATLTRVGANIVQNFQNAGPAPTGPAFINADPQLAALGNYGGPTQTRPPLPGSPALDAAIGSAFTTDQRGFLRPLDGDGNGSALADIGAVERLATVVSQAGNAGPGSLRQALADAQAEPGDDTVRFAPDFTGPVVLAGEISISGNVTIDASALAGGATISGNNAGRLFYVPGGQSLTLIGLTLTGGNGVGAQDSGRGGAIFSNGSVTATRCTFIGNAAPISGGAIFTQGVLSATDSTFAANTGNGGAIRSQGNVTLTRCTLTGNTANTAGSGGGAITLVGGTTTLTHCTLTGNTNAGSSGGGGIYLQSPVTLALANTIVAGNTDTSGIAADIRNASGTVTRSGNNLVGKNTTVAAVFPVGAPNANGDFAGTAAAPVLAQLAALASYGGPTQTMPPLAISPAINGAVSSTATTDQRGCPIVGAAWDIGAVESSIINPAPAHLGGSSRQPTFTWTGPAGATFQVFLGTNAGSLPSIGAPTPATASMLAAPAPLTAATPYFWRVDATIGGVTFTGPVFTFTPAIFVTNANNTGAGSLRQAVADAGSGAYPGADTILFDPAFFNGEPGDTITLASDVSPDSDDLVTVDASPITAGVTLSGGGTNRIFSVGATRNFALIGLTLTGGSSSTTGGAILNNGTLALTRCTFAGNSAAQTGGAILTTGSLTAAASTFSGNTAPTNGGAVAQNAGSSTFTHCTFAANTHTGATQGGGALNHSSSGTSMTLTHCTISGNSSAGSEGGGGIRVRGPAFTMQNCIVAGNTISAGIGADLNHTTNPITANGANIVQSRSGSGTVTGTLTNADPFLAPLGDYGGPTQTMALKAGSPARNTASAGATTDQRGFPMVGTPDIGAYEAGNHLDTIFAAYIWESLPASATLAQHGSAADFDGDGASNFDEWLAQTSAADPNSRLRITSLVRNGLNLDVTFPSVAGRNYTFEFTSTFAPGFTWTPIPGTIAGTGAPLTIALGPVNSFTNFFFRIRVGP